VTYCQIKEANLPYSQKGKKKAQKISTADASQREMVETGV